MDLTAFADAVGTTDPVTVTGSGTRGGAGARRAGGRRAGGHRLDPAGRDDGVRAAPARPSTSWTRRSAEHGQCVALPPGGTVGGALAVGRSGVRRLGGGPVRDTVLQARYVSAAGEVVKAGGPTVKNVSGFDLLPAARRLARHARVPRRRDPAHRPLPRASAGSAAPSTRSRSSARCTGRRRCCGTARRRGCCLEGHEPTSTPRRRRSALAAVDGPPPLPTGGRWSLPPGEVRGA